MANPFISPIPAATSFSVPAARYDSTNVGATGNIIGTEVDSPPDEWLAAGQQRLKYPPVEYFNWFFAYTNNQVNYLRQVGIADWDSRQTYNLGDVVRTITIIDNIPTPRYYRSLVNNNINQTPSPSNVNYWIDFLAVEPYLNSYSTLKMNINSTGIINQLGGRIVPVTANRVNTNGVSFMLADMWHAYAPLNGTANFAVNYQSSGTTVTIPESSAVDPSARPGFIGIAYKETFTHRTYGLTGDNLNCRCRIKVSSTSQVHSIRYWLFALQDGTSPAFDARNGVNAAVDGQIANIVTVDNFVYFDFLYVPGSYFEFRVIPEAGVSLSISGWDLTLSKDGFTNEPIITCDYKTELLVCRESFEIINEDSTSDIVFEWSGGGGGSYYYFDQIYVPYSTVKRDIPSGAAGFPNGSSYKTNGVTFRLNGGAGGAQGINPNAYVYSGR